MSHPRTVGDLLAFLTAHEHQLEHDRDRVKQLVIAKVDIEFDVLLVEVRAHKARLQVGIRNQSARNDSTIETVQVENIDDNNGPNGMDVDQALPSTSRRRRQKRKRTGSCETLLRKRVGTCQHICIYPGCGKSFSKDALLARHERIHIGVRPFSCAWCDCQFDAAERSAVVKHIRTVHLKLPVNKKDQRALNITDRRDPKRWVRVNQQMANRRLTQAECLRASTPSLASSSTLTLKNKRMRKNKDGNNLVPKAIVCKSPGCGFTCVNDFLLANHERAIHLNIRPFHCTWTGCDYTAARFGNVVRHVRTKHFGLPETVKLQRQMNIEDQRDPNQYIRVVQELADQRL